MTFVFSLGLGLVGVSVIRRCWKEVQFQLIDFRCTKFSPLGSHRTSVPSRGRRISLLRRICDGPYLVRQSSRQTPVGWHKPKAAHKWPEWQQTSNPFHVSRGIPRYLLPENRWTWYRLHPDLIPYHIAPRSMVIWLESNNLLLVVVIPRWTCRNIIRYIYQPLSC